MTAGQRHDDPPDSPIEEILSLDEVVARHTDRWVLLRVTSFDEHHQPAAGQVVAVADSDRVVWQTLTKLDAKNGGRAPGSYYVFNAFPRITTGDGWRNVIERIKVEGLPRGWPW